MERSGYPLHRIGSKAVSVQVVDGPFGSDLKVNDYEPTGIPLVRVSNCRTGTIIPDDNLVFISPEKHRELIRSEVLPGDVLLTKAGHILGYAAVFPESLQRGNITSHLASIRPTSGVDPCFLAEFLASPIGLSQIYRWGNKSTRPELNTDEVRKLLIVLPPPDKQRELTSAMNAARSARDAKLIEADALLAGVDGYLLNELGLKSTPSPRKVYAIRTCQLTDSLGAERYAALQLESLLRWTNSVADAVKLVEGRIVPSRKGPDEDWDWLRIDDLPSQPWEAGNLRTERGAAIEGALYSVRENDLLVARLGPTILNAKFVLAPRPTRQTVASPEFLVLRCKRGWHPEVVLWLLRMKLFRDIMYLRSRGGTPSRYRLTGNDLLSIPFPAPNDLPQAAIAAEICHRRERARVLRAEAEAGWHEAKQWFEEQLLGPAP